MKRGRKRGTANFKAIGASGSRRSGNRSNSRLSASPGSISVGNQCNSELEESEAGSDFRSSLPEGMEANGDISLNEQNTIGSFFGHSAENVRGSPGDVSMGNRAKGETGGMILEERGCGEEVANRGETEVALVARFEKGEELVMMLNEIGTVMTEMDIALDLCEAQPLLNIELKSATSGLEVRSGEEGTKRLETWEIYS